MLLFFVIMYVLIHNVYNMERCGTGISVPDVACTGEYAHTHFSCPISYGIQGGLRTFWESVWRLFRSVPVHECYTPPGKVYTP